jgi:LysM repeat protein
MNNQSPFVPQGSLPEQKNKNRARVKIAVFFVLAVHGIGLMALLMQGCKPSTDTNSTTSTQVDTNPPPFIVATNPVAPPDTNTALAAQPPPIPQTDPTNAAPVTPLAGGSDYKIAKGDTLAIVAKRSHVSLKAIQEANPGVEPTKLKIGQTIHVPAASSAVAGAAKTTAGGAASAAESSGNEHIYSVQSGDNLTRIASKFGTTVKVIRTANHLRTDRLTVGQKLRVPAKNAAVLPASASSPEAAMLSASASTSAPGSATQ